MKAKILNVREHLERIDRLLTGYKKYGDCPAIEEELRSIGIINRMILKEHYKTRKAGNRKDIRINS